MRDLSKDKALAADLLYKTSELLHSTSMRLPCLYICGCSVKYAVIFIVYALHVKTCLLEKKDLSQLCDVNVYSSQ